MGCGTSNSSQQQTDDPQKGAKQQKNKSKQTQDEVLLGNQIPQYYVDENKNEQNQQVDTHRSNQTEHHQAQQKPSEAPKTRKQKKNQKNFKAQSEVDQQELFENITKKQKKMKPQDLQLIVQSLKGHSVFYALSNTELEQIVIQMFYCEVGNGEYVFKQGDQASSYLILEKGKVEIIIDGDSKKILDKGAGFGELALLYNAPRSASVRCIGQCAFWAIDRNTFRTTVEEMVHKEFSSNRNFMENVTFFSFMNDEQKDAIASGLIQQKFEKGQNIVNEGDQADSFYMIKEGVVSIFKGDKFIRDLNAKDSFGESALYMQSTRAATVKAASKTVKVLSLGRLNITKILGEKVQVIIYNNLQRWAYDKSALLQNLTKIQIEKITQNGEIINKKKGDVLVSKGQKCQNLYIVLEGAIKLRSGNSILAARGGIWGDKYLKLDQQNEQMSDDVIMESDGVVSRITYKHFFKCVGSEDITEVIKRNEQGHEKKMAALDKKPDYSHIKLENLIFIKELGSGQFGTVYLVKEKESKKNELFALKSVSKAQIIEQSLEKHLIQEKTVLEQVHFPFIMNFYRTFKDNQFVYFLTEYISGQELFDVIRAIGLLSTYDSQFYAGSMILGLEYLHSKSIIYRDIKPENIMVDHMGNMFLIDMGTAKILSFGKHPGRTFTIIGTPHYMAPEIIQQKGYSYGIDLWSVGICIYEFMCGAVPYAEEAEDPFEIYEEIMNSPVRFPSWMNDKKAKDFIKQLLEKVPELRLRGSYAALKANPWFDNFDWDKLYNKELEPPYKIPDDKIISNKEIKAQFKQLIPVNQEILIEQKQQKKKYKKENARDPNWDKDF